MLIFSLLSFARAFAWFKVTLASITNMTNKITERVLRAQILFFDSNPIGRILTRFTKDVSLLDLIYPQQSLMVVNGILRTIAVVVTACIINPYILIPSAICLVLMIFFMKVGSANMQQGKIIDQLEREPINSTLTLLFNGLVSCRISEKIPYFKQGFMNAMYRGTNAMFCSNMISRWIGIRLDMTCTLFSVCVAWLCIIMKKKTNTTTLIVTL